MNAVDELLRRIGRGTVGIAAAGLTIFLVLRFVVPTPPPPPDFGYYEIDGQLATSVVQAGGVTIPDGDTPIARGSRVKAEADRLAAAIREGELEERRLGDQVAGLRCCMESRQGEDERCAAAARVFLAGIQARADQLDIAAIEHLAAEKASQLGLAHR